MNDYYVYMLHCADDSYYVGVTRNVEQRLWQHNFGDNERAYTFSRRPVRVVHVSNFHDILQAIAWEKQLKGWSRAKKAALVNDDWERIHQIVYAELVESRQRGR